MCENIMIVGASGKALGMKVTNSFLKRQDEFNLSILISKESMKNEEKKRIFQDFQKQGAKLIEGELDDAIGLEKALQGIDVVICLLTGNDQKVLFNGQKSLIEASKKVHVKRFITSDYGMELSRIKENECHYYKPKQEIQKILEQDSSIEHTFIATGLFADFLFTPYFGIDLKQRKIQFFGPSNMKISTTYSNDIALLLPDIILLEECKNARIDLASFTTTFNEIYEIAQQMTGQNFEFIENQSYQNLTSEQLYEQVSEFVKSVYARGDGFFEKPFNKIHPKLSKIQTTTIEDLIKMKINE